jgi:hypothetical protein
MIGIKNRVRALTTFRRGVVGDRSSVLAHLFHIFLAHAHEQLDAKLLGQF